MGTIDLYHYKPLSVALTLHEGYTVRSFSYTLFNWCNLKEFKLVIQISLYNEIYVIKENNWLLHFVCFLFLFVFFYNYCHIST